MKMGLGRKKELRRLSMAILALCGMGFCGVMEVDATTYTAGNGSVQDTYGGSSDAVAIGSSSLADYDSAAYGYNARASAPWTTAIGSSSSASARYAAAIGNTSTASQMYATALGYSSYATGEHAISIGDSSAGAAQAIAIGRKAVASGTNSVAIGGSDSSSASASGNYSYAFGYNSNASAESAIAFGSNSKTEAVHSVSLGSLAQVIGTGATFATALGYSSYATATYAISIGDSEASNAQAIAVGRYAKASGTNSVAIGGYSTSDQGAQATESYAIALGAYSQATATEAISIGYDTTATGEHSLTIGDCSNATKQRAIAIGCCVEVNGEYSMAVGWSAGTSTATYATALGPNAKATGNNSFAGGRNTQAAAANAVAIGGNATSGLGALANSASSVAVGDTSKAYGTGGTAIGNLAAVGTSSAVADYATALGYSSSATATYAISIGDSVASNSQAIAIGRYAAASGTNSVAIGGSASDGSGATASKDYATAVGYLSKATGNYSTAWGYKSTASGTYSYAYGYNSNSSGESAIALGSNTTSPASFSVAIGSGATVSGTSSERAIAIGQATASNAQAIAAGRYAKASGTNSVAIGGNATSGSGALASGASSVAMGDTAKALAQNAVAFGKSAVAGETTTTTTSSGTTTTTTGVSAVSIGDSASATKDYSIAFGYSASATADYAVSIGDSVAGGAQAFAAGRYASAGAKNAIAIGGSDTASKGANASVADSIAIGEQSAASGTKAIAIGQGAKATSNNAVALGDGSVTSEVNSVSVGASTSSTRTITNVTAGDSTKDAAIWDQIAAEGKTVELSTDTRDTVGTKTVQKNQIATNDGTVLATFKKMAAVSSTDTGFVSGTDLYNETRLNIPATNNYISAQDAGANLAALDKAIGKTVKGEYISAQDGSTVTVASNLKELDTALYEHSKLVKTNNATATSATKILIGNDVDFSGVTEVSVGTLAGGTRTIGGVSKGTATAQAAIWDQIAAEGKTVKLSIEAREAVGGKTIQHNQIAANDGTVLATFQKMQSIAIDDDGFVSGKDLYKELKVTESGSYVKKSNTTAENLLALDRALSGGGIVRVGTENKTKIYVGLNPEGETTYDAVTDIDIGNGGIRTISGLKGGTAAGQAVEFSQVNTVAPMRTNGTYLTSTLNADGTLNTAGTVGTNLAALDAKAVSTASGTNVIDLSDAGKKLVSNDGSTLATFTRMSEVKATDTGFVSGTDLYHETRANLGATNNYISAQDAGANLATLDQAIGKTAKGTYISAQDGTNVTVATNLSALDVALAEQAKIVRVAAEDTTKILVGNDTKFDNVTTVNVAKTDGTARTISGVAAGTNTTDAANVGQLIKEATAATAATAGDVQTAKLKFNDTNLSDLSIAIAGEGAVASGDQRLVNGDTVYNYDKPVAKSGYTLTNVNETASTGTNLGTLDAAIVDQQRLIKNDSTNKKIVIAGDTTLANSDTVTVSTSAGGTRTISGVTAGSANTDAANVGQLLAGGTYQATGNNVAGNIQTATITSKDGNTTVSIAIAGEGAVAENDVRLVNGDTVWKSTVKSGEVNLSATGNKVYTNGDSTNALLTFEKMTDVSATDTGFVSGGDLWNETRKEIPETGNNYIAQGYSAGENLKALDTKIGQAKAGNYYTADEDVETQIQKVDAALAKNSTIVRVNGEDPSQILVGRSTADVDYSGVTSIDVSNGDTSYRKVTGVAYGGDTNDNHDAVAYGQIAKAGQTIELGKDGGNMTLKTNDEATTLATVTITEAAVSSGNKGIVTGGVAYTELRDGVTGNYVNADFKTAKNISQLDKAIGKTTQGTYITAQDGNMTTVATNLQELDAALATQSKLVRLGSDDSANKIFIGKNKDATEYAAFDTIDVGNGGTRTVSGVAAGTQNTDAANVGQLADNQEYVFDTSTGIATIKTKDNGTAFRLKLASNGEVASGDAGLVSGGKVYTEVRPADGNYVKTAQTTATNLTALDSAIGNVTADGNYITKSLNDNGTLKTSVAANLSALDTKIGVAKAGTNYAATDNVETQIYKVDQKGVKAGQTFTLNSTATGKVADIKANDGTTSLATVTVSVGTITETSTGFVDGATVYAYDKPVAKDGYTLTNVVETASTGTNLGKLDAAVVDQQRLIKNDSTNKKIVIAGDATLDASDTVTIFDSNNGTRKLTGVTYGENNNDAAAFGQLIKETTDATSGGDASKAQTATLKFNDGDLSDLTIAVAGEGAVVDGDKRLISGETLYNENRKAIAESNQAKYHISDQSAAANILALDGYIGKVEDGSPDNTDPTKKTYNTISSTNTVSQNLQALDAATAETEGLITLNADKTQILVGSGDNAANATSVSFANNNNDTRTLSGITSGKTTGEAVEFSQINTVAPAAQTNGTYIKSTLKADNTLDAEGTVGKNIAALDAKALAKATDTVNKVDLSTEGAKLVSNDGTTLANFTKMQNVASDDNGFVSGSDLYAENRDGITSENYIRKGATAGANLSALDQAFAKNSTIVRVNENDATQILVGRSTADVDYSGVTSIDVSNGGTSYRKVTGVAYGGNTNEAVAYGQIVKAGQTIELGKDGGNMTLKTNDEATTLATVTVTEASVASGNKGIVTGGVAYTELRDGVTGNYVNADFKTAKNISQLDKAIGKTTQGTYITAQDGNTTTVAKNLQELDAALATQAKLVRLGKDDSANKIFIGKNTDGADYSAITTIDVGNGGTRTIAGVSAGTQNTDAANVGQLVKNEEYTFDTATGIATIKTKDNGTAFTLKLASNGEVAETDSGLVSGAKVYAEVRPADGNYVKNTQTTATNLTALDSAIGAKQSGYYITSGVNDTVYSNLKKLDSQIGQITAGDYAVIDDEATVSANLVALNNALDSRNNLITYAESASQIQIGHGISGGTVSFADSSGTARTLSDVANGTANTDAVNFGQLKSYGIKGGAYEVTADNPSARTATIKNADGSDAFTLTVYASATLRYTGDGKTIGIKDSESGKDIIISAKTGKIEENAETLVTGDTVYKEFEKRVGTMQDGNWIGADKTAAENVSALDSKIGKITDGDYKAIKADATVSANLIALDSALGGTNVDVSRLKNNTRSDTANATGANSVALGYNSLAEGADSISIGTSAKATKANAVAIGNGYIVEGENSVAIGKGDGKTTIISGQDSIAIGTGHIISGNNSGAFGDPTIIKADNSYSVGNNNTLTTEGTFVLGNNVTTTAKNSVILGNGSEAKEENVVSVGAEGSERRIVNVAPGVNDTDAVNMSQLRAQLGGNVEALRSELKSDIHNAAAGAAALAALHPGEYDPDDKLSFAIGYGHYRNANAGALGAFYKPNEDTMVSVGGTLGNGNPMFNVGLSFKLGERGKSAGVPRSSSEMAKEMNRLRSDNKALKENNASQAKKINALESDNAEMKKNDAKQQAEIRDLRADNEKMKAQIAMILENMKLSDTVTKTAAR